MSNNVLDATGGNLNNLADWLGDTDLKVLKASYIRTRPDTMRALASITVLPAAPQAEQPLASREPSKTSPQRNRCKRGHLYKASTTRQRRAPNGSIWDECLRCERDQKAGVLAAIVDKSGNETATAPTNGRRAKTANDGVSDASIRATDRD